MQSNRRSSTKSTATQGTTSSGTSRTARSATRTSQPRAAFGSSKSRFPDLPVKPSTTVRRNPSRGPSKHRHSDESSLSNHPVATEIVATIDPVLEDLPAPALEEVESSSNGLSGFLSPLISRVKDLTKSTPALPPVDAVTRHSVSEALSPIPRTNTTSSASVLSPVFNSGVIHMHEQDHDDSITYPQDEALNASHLHTHADISTIKHNNNSSSSSTSASAGMSTGADVGVGDVSLLDNIYADMHFGATTTSNNTNTLSTHPGSSHSYTNLSDADDDDPNSTAHMRFLSHDDSLDSTEDASLGTGMHARGNMSTTAVLNRSGVRALIGRVVDTLNSSFSSITGSNGSADTPTDNGTNSGASTSDTSAESSMSAAVREMSAMGEVVYNATDSIPGAGADTSADSLVSLDSLVGIDTRVNTMLNRTGGGGGRSVDVKSVADIEVDDDKDKLAYQARLEKIYQHHLQRRVLSPTPRRPTTSTGASVTTPGQSVYSVVSPLRKKYGVGPGSSSGLYSLTPQHASIGTYSTPYRHFYSLTKSSTGGDTPLVSRSLTTVIDEEEDGEDSRTHTNSYYDDKSFSFGTRTHPNHPANVDTHAGTVAGQPPHDSPARKAAAVRPAHAVGSSGSPRVLICGFLPLTYVFVILAVLVNVILLWHAPITLGFNWFSLARLNTADVPAIADAYSPAEWSAALLMLDEAQASIQASSGDSPQKHVANTLVDKAKLRLGLLQVQARGTHALLLAARDEIDDLQIQLLQAKEDSVVASSMLDHERSKWGRERARLEAEMVANVNAARTGACVCEDCGVYVADARASAIAHATELKQCQQHVSELSEAKTGLVEEMRKTLEGYEQCRLTITQNEEQCESKTSEMLAAAAKAAANTAEAVAKLQEDLHVCESARTAADNDAVLARGEVEKMKSTVAAATAETATATAAAAVAAADATAARAEADAARAALAEVKGGVSTLKQASIPTSATTPTSPSSTVDATGNATSLARDDTCAAELLTTRTTLAEASNTLSLLRAELAESQANVEEANKKVGALKDVCELAATRAKRQLVECQEIAMKHEVSAGILQDALTAAQESCESVGVQGEKAAAGVVMCPRCDCSAASTTGDGDGSGSGSGNVTKMKPTVHVHCDDDDEDCLDMQKHTQEQQQRRVDAAHVGEGADACTAALSDAQAQLLALQSRVGNENNAANAAKEQQQVCENKLIALTTAARTQEDELAKAVSEAAEAGARAAAAAEELSAVRAVLVEREAEIDAAKATATAAAASCAGDKMEDTCKCDITTTTTVDADDAICGICAARVRALENELQSTVGEVAARATLWRVERQEQSEHVRALVGDVVEECKRVCESDREWEKKVAEEHEHCHDHDHTHHTAFGDTILGSDSHGHAHVHWDEEEAAQKLEQCLISCAKAGVTRVTAFETAFPAPPAAASAGAVNANIVASEEGEEMCLTRVAALELELEAISAQRLLDDQHRANATLACAVCDKITADSVAESADAATAAADVEARVTAAVESVEASWTQATSQLLRAAEADNEITHRALVQTQKQLDELKVVVARVVADTRTVVDSTRAPVSEVNAEPIVSPLLTRDPLAAMLSTSVLTPIAARAAKLAVIVCVAVVDILVVYTLLPAAILGRVAVTLAWMAVAAHMLLSDAWTVAALFTVNAVLAVVGVVLPGAVVNVSWRNGLVVE